MRFRSAIRISDIPVSILVAVLFLSGMGLLALYSVSQNQDVSFFQNSFYKQCLFLIPALAAMIGILYTPLQSIHKYSYLFFGISIFAIAIPFARDTVAGTHRWIMIGTFGLQPSEFAKVILVVTLARYLSDRNLELQKMRSLIMPLIISLIPVFIVFKQPDLGTAVVLMTPVLPMLYWAGARPYHLFLFLAPFFSILTAFHTISFTLWGIAMVLALYSARPKLIVGIATYFGNLFLGLLAPYLWSLLKDYQQQRILTFLNPELDPLGSAYQIIQSQTAIGSGGVFGKGLGHGTQTHLKFLPVQESDFILSVIGEELGFAVIAVVLGVFTWLILKMIHLAFDSKDRFSGLVIFGLSMILLAHVFVNTTMTVGLIPVKGLPLPFISYGGSFLVVCYIMIGLVLKLGMKSTE